MKRIATLLILALAALDCIAQEHLSERVYVSTDRDVYVAGDELFFSAFCLDMHAGGLSGGSRTAYLEIVSSDGPVQTAKVALEGGRGGGVIHLLNTIPSGEYRLTAYTAQCFNEDGYDFLEGAKTLSIINPFTTARAASGVRILSDEEYAGLEEPVRPSAGGVRLDASGALTVTNTSDRPVTLSVSVFNDDGIVSPETLTPVGFSAGATAGTNFTQRRTVDFEGEVIRARLVGTEEEIASSEGVTAFISVPGRTDDIYSSRIAPDGTATFFTGNIYGQTNLVLDAGGGVSNAHLEIIPPFAEVSDPGLSELPLSSGLQDRILLRSLSAQVRAASGADSLYVRIPRPQGGLFPADSIVYVLDDYTRFPLMEELFTEFIMEIHARRSSAGRELTVVLNDSFRPSGWASSPCLVLLDGVPVSDHNVIFDYDPLLVERVVIYPHTCYIGGRTYPGVVDFVTYKHDLPSYRFGDSVRVVDFQGVEEPVISWLPDQSPDVPDLRQTVLWHPIVELAPGESRVLEYVLPSYEGDFKAVVEGFDDTGAPQYVRSACQ